jgi:hypothetical protein
MNRLSADFQSNSRHRPIPYGHHSAALLRAASMPQSYRLTGEMVLVGISPVSYFSAGADWIRIARLLDATNADSRERDRAIQEGERGGAQNYRKCRGELCSSMKDTHFCVLRCFAAWQS